MTKPSSTPEARVAVFPGQGGQAQGMAQSLIEQFPAAREIFAVASEAIGVDLTRLCRIGSASELALTVNAQPCILTASVAALEVAKIETGFVPDIVAGHSLGEYSALVASGALRSADAVRWVRARGQAMQEAVPVGQGGMLAVLGLGEQAVRTLCERAQAIVVSRRRELKIPPVAAIANYNAPGQYIVSGASDVLQAIEHTVENSDDDDAVAGAIVRPLSVSAPFHCSLMRPARMAMEAEFEGAEVHATGIPYVPNCTAQATPVDAQVFPRLLQQIDGPVLWEQSIGSLLNSGYATFVEFGPGRALVDMIRRIARASRRTAYTVAVADADDIAKLIQVQAHAG